MKYRILSFLEKNSLFDQFEYINYELDLLLDTLIDLSNDKLIEFYLYRESESINNVNIYRYSKRLTEKGMEYLSYLKHKFNQTNN